MTRPRSAPPVNASKTVSPRPLIYLTCGVIAPLPTAIVRNEQARHHKYFRHRKGCALRATMIPRPAQSHSQWLRCLFGDADHERNDNGRNDTKPLMLRPPAIDENCNLSLACLAWAPLMVLEWSAGAALRCQGGGDDDSPRSVQVSHVSTGNVQLSSLSYLPNPVLP